MAFTIGVIGPEDLVDRVVAAGAEHGARLVALPYRHETDAVAIAGRAQDTMDAFLFTGVVPYTLAAGTVARPAMYVPYNGATLLRALVELLRLGHDVTRLSIDTLRRAEVIETLTEARLPTDHIQVLPYRPGLTSRDLVDFHRAARERHGATVAITCLGSAFHVLDTEMHAVRLAPSRHSISSTLQALILTTTSQYIEDAQVALGLVALPGPDDRLAADLAVLGGSLAPLPDGRHLVVTTRGLLEKVTRRFSRLPLLDQLAARHATAHVGFGVGRTAAEAETLAWRALNRATAIGPVAGLVSLLDDVDIVIEPGAGGAADGDDGIPQLARRVGLHPRTLERLRELTAATPDRGLTALDVAGHLDVQQRSARRVLKRLERAGLATPSGHQQHAGRSGRPPVVYRLHL